MHERYKKRGVEPISDEVSLRWIIEITQGLAALHDLHIVHRDLKMQNCFLTSTSDDAAQCKIGDLGLAKQTEASEELMSSMVGTQSTMAPEVLRGQRYTAKADIYSLACIAHELLTTQKLNFAGRTEDMVSVVT